MKPLLTTQELAQLLGVSERHLYRQHAAGKLPRPVRIGRCVRWDPDDFLNMFKNRKEQHGNR